MADYTQQIVDTLATNAQCCYVNKMNVVLDMIEIGDPIWKELWREAFYISALIHVLKDYVITTNCLIDSEVCDVIRRLEAICSNCCA